jgi:hypothetical protein
MQSNGLKMRKIDLMLKLRSMMLIAAGEPLTVANSDDNLRKGTDKFDLLRASLDVLLLQEYVEDTARLPDHTTELGVPGNGGNSRGQS